MKLIIFDLDGTLFRTETVDIVAINRALEENGYKNRYKSEILKLIGVTLDEACISLINTKDKDVIEKLKKDIIRFEKEEVEKYGELYEGVLEGLIRLKNLGFTLCICSNGNEEYIKQISKKFNLPEIFEEISYSDSKFTKSQRVRRIKDKYRADKFIMVGDRTSDIEAARENDGISIGVTYGFGKDEPHQADYIAKDFNEIESTIEEIFKEENLISYS
ncbi:HAD family hydrolase [Clostridium sp. D2Q-11]|uniref:HAD family hydrolase n=1 Tax=Anaeromonas frigoriresistens TaxID=2683708 RepID=A0A942V2V9_9FIRM|nr:HAD family hydrolase [Anaeromonas frigoriresistens]MBS4538967.1 HAD family hydrolase [Anaeromonas frigoriresistens]